MFKSQGKYWFRIGDKTFYAIEMQAQLKTYGGATISITLDDINNLAYFVSLADMHNKKEKKKFDLLSTQFRGCGCLITNIDFSSNIKIELHCDYIYNKDIRERREDILTEIFKEIENKKHNNS
jgi:hypothetical protein